MTCTRTRVATFKSKRNTGKIVEDLEQVRITQQQHKKPPSRKKTKTKTKEKQKQKQKLAYNEQTKHSTNRHTHVISIFPNNQYVLDVLDTL